MPGWPHGSPQILRGLRNVSVVQGDGARVLFDSADIIYVNAGATKPARRGSIDWLRAGG